MIPTTSLIVAGLATLVAAKPMAPIAPFKIVSRNTSAPYQTYLGSGTVAEGWPSTSTWLDFEALYTLNTNFYAASGACEYLGVGINTDAENAAIKSAILDVAEETGLDARFILAAVFQESAGCVRVKTSYSSTQGYRNPGLLQCFQGGHSCNDPEAGIPLTKPCPDSEIHGMITDGVGITTDDGLLQVVERSGATDVSKYYKGATLYNSGVMPESGDLEDGRSNPCYGSDMTNRLLGWVDSKSPCDRETIGDN